MTSTQPRSPSAWMSALTPWMIALIEGASTLAVEVIAIRLAVPVVGSSAALTGIMLGVVLLALSAGYWRGGVFSSRWDHRKMEIALTRNLLLAAVLYGAVSFQLEAPMMERLLDSGVTLPWSIGLTAMLLLAPPIYLASQTVPLLAELTNRDGKAGKASGKVLFFSTIGSVAGGIVTPIWLFPTIGVQHATEVVCGLLAAAACLAGWQRLRAPTAGLTAAALLIVIGAHAFAAPAAREFVFDSAYQTFRIVPEEREGRMSRTLILSGSRASGVYADNGATSFTYVLEAEKALAEVNPKRVLVIGAAGFTFPRDAARRSGVERVDAVDVDPVVKDIAETRFLKEKLSPAIHFLPLSARYAVRKLNKDGERYGFTLVDAYYGKGIPEELVTVEFFKDIAKLSDRTIMNVIMDPKMASRFSRSLLATFSDAFGVAWVKRPSDEESGLVNVMVSNWPTADFVRWAGAGTVYRDDKSTANLDWVRLIRSANED